MDDPVAKAVPDQWVGEADALALLAAFEGATEKPNNDASTALGLLALVAGQDVEQDADGTWKIARRVDPDRDHLNGRPKAGHMHKSRSEYRDGYKAHIAIEPETGRVTAAALTPANSPPTGRPGLNCWPAKNPDSRSSPTAPMDRVRRSLRWRCIGTDGHQALPDVDGHSRWLRSRRLRRR